MGDVLRRFPFCKASKPARQSVTNVGRTAVQLGGVLPVLFRQVARAGGSGTVTRNCQKQSFREQFPMTRTPSFGNSYLINLKEVQIGIGIGKFPEMNFQELRIGKRD